MEVDVTGVFICKFQKHLHIMVSAKFTSSDSCQGTDSDKTAITLNYNFISYSSN